MQRLLVQILLSAFKKKEENSLLLRACKSFSKSIEKPVTKNNYKLNNTPEIKFEPQHIQFFQKFICWQEKTNNRPILPVYKPRLSQHQDFLSCVPHPE